MGLLADIFSYGDTQKRRIRGLLDDPVGTLGLGATRAVEDQDGLLNTFANAYPMAGDKTVLNTPAQRKQMQAQAANKALEVYGGLLGATVWHGSPHKFDKFDSRKIGTGEGAQAYGHGLYLAENPAVAKGYATTLANRDSGGYLTAHKNAQDLVARFKGDPEWAAEVVTDQLANLPRTDPNFARLTDTLSAIKSGAYAKPLENPGALYKVDLPDEHIAKMLDWDKPLSQQHPDVQKAIKGGGPYKDGLRMQMPDVAPYVQERITGGDLYRTLIDKIGNSEAAGYKLNRIGIPGIRYLDGGSRGAGGGTSNFVVFPGGEGLLSILERNGQPIK